MTEPQFLEELPSEMISLKINPAWACDVIEEAKRHGAPEGTIRERKKQKGMVPQKEPLEKGRSQSHIPVIWL